jgi:hypothetical protein
MTFIQGKDIGFNDCDEVLIVGDGFLVPGKSTGSISVIKNLEDNHSKVIELSHEKKGWFYHLALVIDMNNDGRKDILTARATKSLLGF